MGIEPTRRKINTYIINRLQMAKMAWGTSGGRFFFLFFNVSNVRITRIT